MSSRLKLDLLHPAEFGWLLGLAFFLPLFEAPKNLCWLGYVLTWLYNRVRDHDWGGPWDRWDSLIAAWIASGYIVAAFAGIHYDEWGGANDILRYGSVLWLLKRSRFEERALLWILGAIIAATLVTLAWGFWRLFVAKTNMTLGLNSVGHVNHSAIYMAIAFGVALSLATSYWRGMSTSMRVCSAFACLALIASVIVTESRASLGAASLYVLVLFAVFAYRRYTQPMKGVFVVFLAMAIGLAVDPGVLRKSADRVQEGNVLAFRSEIWTNGLVEWRKFPLFGVGMGNYGRVGLEQLQEWSRTQEGRLRPSARGIASHGHSLYLTTLAERGVFGLTVLLAVLVAWGAALARAVPRAQDPPLEWALFQAALSGWLVTVVVGLVNTTLHHEHAILSVLPFGLWLSHRTASNLSYRNVPRP